MKHFKKIFLLVVLGFMLNILFSNKVAAQSYSSTDKKYTININSTYLIKDGDTKKNSITGSPNPTFENEENSVLIEPNLNVNEEEIKKIAKENLDSNSTFKGYIGIDYNLTLPDEINSAFLIDDPINFVMSIIQLSFNKDLDINSLYKPKKLTISNKQVSSTSKILYVNYSNEKLTIEPYVETKDETSTTRMGLGDLIYSSKTSMNSFDYNRVLSASNEDNIMFYIGQDMEKLDLFSENNSNYFEMSSKYLSEISKDTFKTKDSYQGYIFNILDENNNILYSWQFDSNTITNTDIDLLTTIKINDEETKNKFKNIYGNLGGVTLSFEHDGAFPGEALIKINSNNLYDNGEILNLYYFNDSTKKFELIDDNIKVNNNFIEMRLNHASDYLLTEEPLNLNIGNQNIRNSKTGTNISLILIIALLSLGLSIFIYTKNKNMFPQV